MPYLWHTACILACIARLTFAASVPACVPCAQTNLADVFARVGRLEEAESMHKAAFDSSLNALGPYSPVTHTALLGYRHFLKDTMGRKADADALEAQAAKKGIKLVHRA